MADNRKITQKELTQRQDAARSHGFYAFQARGEAALDAPQRSRLQEIREQVQDNQGILDAMIERTAAAVMLAELAEAWIRDQAERGVPFDQMTMLNRISNFQETARRHLLQLSQMIPKDQGAIDITELLRGDNGG